MTELQAGQRDVKSADGMFSVFGFRASVVSKG